MHPLLSVEGLSVSFPGEERRIDALRSVSFGLQKGEVLALVGESGSGKSVTALSILQLLQRPAARVDSGRILFSPDGARQTDLLRLSEKEMNDIRGSGISMIFQEPMTSLNPVMTCGRQVSEAVLAKGGIGKREARQRALELFDRVRLPDPPSVYDRYPHQLSGGQKQRVMIAMAMCGGPSLLMADEPTTALDVTVQKSILSLIDTFRREEGMGVVFITHDLGVVAETADRVAVMYKGRIVEQGTVGSVLSNPAHDYTRALLACRPGLHPRKSRLPVVADFMAAGATGVQGRGETETPQPQAPTEEPGQGKPLLQVRGLSVAYPGRKGSHGVRAVDGMDFEVYEGETLGLVGESGCGKTTLGRAILGLVKPDSGEVLLRGRDLARMGRKEWMPFRKELQIVFQDPYGSLNPRMTVGSAIAEPMDVHGLGERASSLRGKVVERLEMVDLRAEHYDRYPHEFSGGQRQRIGIARALSVDPSFIVFDESVSALDVSVQAQVLNLLLDLKRRLGFTSLFISHDLSVVHHVSDRILVMKQGRIVESGPAEEVFGNPRAEYTRRLLDSIPGGLKPRAKAD